MNLTDRLKPQPFHKQAEAREKYPFQAEPSNNIGHTPLLGINFTQYLESWHKYTLYM